MTSPALTLKTPSAELAALGDPNTVDGWHHGLPARQELARRAARRLPSKVYGTSEADAVRAVMAEAPTCTYAKQVAYLVLAEFAAQVARAAEHEFQQIIAEAVARWHFEADANIHVKPELFDDDGVPYSFEAPVGWMAGNWDLASDTEELGLPCPDTDSEDYEEMERYVLLHYQYLAEEAIEAARATA